MKKSKIPSPHNPQLSQRKQNSKLQNLYSSNGTDKPSGNSNPFMKYVNKVALFFTFLFKQTKPTKPNVFLKGNASSIDVSTGSPLKTSLKFKLSNSHGSSSSASGMIGTMSFTFEEIYKATQKFSQANVIGEGGFGTVYKGLLKDGTLVAVKRAKKNTYDRGLSLEFKNEIVALSMIEHLNLVRLFGYLEHGDERIIVVEYVCNGTLREHLDGIQGERFEMGERLDIAIDVAHAITYLHTYMDPPIIHRDIKSSNILITEKMRAKVADFGFARMATENLDATHISTQIKGTAGYLDPEYVRTYQLTEKSDVYSFGVLLIELMTARFPIELKKPDSERLTPRWAIKKLKEGDAVLTMDPKLRRNPASTLAVEKVLKVAHKCLAPTRHSRPSMKNCVELLWVIRKDYQEMAFPSSHATSHHSSNYPTRDPKKTRQILFGIEDENTHKFISS